MRKLEWNTKRRAEVARLLPLLYSRSLNHFGPQNWWPGETREEVIIGAVLTQNTAWTNVERALSELRRDIPITLRAVAEMEPRRLAERIRPVGYFTVKAKRLQAVARWFVERCGAREKGSGRGALQARRAGERSGNPSGGGGSEALACVPPRRRFSEDGLSVNLTPLIGLKGADLEALRQEILGVHGVGPETADSILLYALDGDTFVIDAYTMRIGERHGLFPPGATYEEAKLIFEGVLGRDVDWFNDYHAQIVALGKYFCKTRNPLCEQCPLGSKECFAGGKMYRE